MTKLVLESGSIRHAERVVLENVTVQFNSGELVAILGANGAGKSTLVRSLLGIINLNNGKAYIDDVISHEIKPADRARKVSYLPQTRRLSWPLTVKDTVALGRFAHGVRLGHLKEDDEEYVSKAMAECDLTEFAARRVDQLSGGELARVHCARAFASQAPMLVADEPIAELDPWHQFQLMQLIRQYVDTGNGAIVILHDPEIAARFADRIVWMVDGKVVADGPPMSTLTSEQLASVYGMKADVFWRDKDPQVTMIEPINQ